MTLVAHLTVPYGANAGAETVADEDPVTIGSGGGLMVVGDGVVSEHARVCRVDGHFAVVDLGAKAGVFVNGDRIDEAQFLDSGDVIYVGTNGCVAIRVELVDEDILRDQRDRERGLARAMAEADPVQLAELSDAPTSDEVLVFADECERRGDPRGRHILLCHRMSKARSAKERHELSRAIGAHLEEHRAFLFGKRTGFPFGVLRGRHFVEFRGTGRSRMRGKPGRPMFRRLRSLFEEVTTCAGASVIAVSPLEAKAWSETLGRAKSTDGADLPRGLHAYWTPAVPLSFDAIDTLLQSEPTRAYFQFTFSFTGDGVPLPYVEKGFYDLGRTKGGTTESVIWINLGTHDSGRGAVRLFLPFENMRQAGFKALWSHCQKHLGSLLSAKSGLRRAHTLS